MIVFDTDNAMVVGSGNQDLPSCIPQVRRKNCDCFKMILFEILSSNVSQCICLLRELFVIFVSEIVEGFLHPGVLLG